MIKKMLPSEIEKAIQYIKEYGFQAFEQYQDWNIKEILKWINDEINRIDTAFKEDSKYSDEEIKFLFIQRNRISDIQDKINYFAIEKNRQKHYNAQKAEIDLLNLKADDIQKKYTEYKKRVKPIPNPVKSTFCLWIKNSNHYKVIGLDNFINDDGTVKRKKYVEAVCKHYNLIYKERMIKADWSEEDRIDKYYEKIKNQIYPKIDKETIQAIENYINSNKPHH